MRRYVLGTAGHVDHGKTTLVQALTGVDTDRLPEEKRRGITIELGFAPWHLGDGVEVSLIDVPGHRRLVHHMIAGATGMELLLLVVAADEGVMPQTREHVAAAELLGLRRVVVAVTKTDRVGAEVAELAGEEARELLAGRFEIDVVQCSARTGEGIAALTETVRRALPTLAPRTAAPRARLSIDRVFTVKGAGTVITGTLVEGKIAVGAPLTVVGETDVRTTSARGLQVHDHAVTLAEAPTRLAINLAGLGLDEVARGDVVTDDPAARATRLCDVMLRSRGAVKSGQVAQVYVGTARAACRVDVLADDGEEGAPVLARLRLTHPLVAFGGDRFVLRGSQVAGPAGAVLGGGVILDADPPRRKPREARRVALLALAAGDASAAVRALVAEAEPRPLATAKLPSRFVVDAAALRRAADQSVGKGELVAITARGEGGGKARLFGWAQPSTLVALAALARTLVAEHHEKAPLDRGLGLETLRKKIAARAGAEAAEEAIRRATETPASRDAPPAASKGRAKVARVEPIVVEGDVVRLATFDGALASAASAGTLGAAARAIADAELKGMTEHGVGVATGASPKEVKAILAKLVRDQVAIHAGDLWFSRASFDAVKGKVEAHLATAPKLTIADFKEMIALGRKQAILLLELLDREGVTRRDGDDRVAPR